MRIIPLRRVIEEGGWERVLKFTPNGSMYLADVRQWWASPDRLHVFLRSPIVFGNYLFYSVAVTELSTDQLDTLESYSPTALNYPRFITAEEALDIVYLYQKEQEK